MPDINLTTDAQETAFEQAAAQVREDYDADNVDGYTPDRGRAAGELPAGEVVRILAEAYTGDLDWAGE